MTAQRAGRREDVRLVSGQGGYVADFLDASVCVAGFVRAGVATGRHLSVDATAARDMPGVLAVFTADDLAADGIGPIRHVGLPRDDGGAPEEHPQPILAADEVRHAGQPLALVIARGAHALADAVEAVAVEMDEVEPPSGVAFLRRLGEREAVAAAFAAAVHRCDVALEIPRMTAFALEPRCALARPRDDGGLEYRVSTQNPFAVRTQLAAQLGLDAATIRVVALDVGGSFGLKGFMAPEDAALAWAALRLGAPVAWLPTRSETMLADAQGRGVSAEMSLALDADLRLSAIDARFRIDAGAFPGGGAFGVINNVNGLTGTYRVGCAAVEIEGRLSARPPLAPFRGNGRPEVTQTIEGALDAAARQIGVDPVELRRRNLIPAAQMPTVTALGTRIDCGDFPRVMEAALALNAGAAERRVAAEARGMLYGVGLANCIESAGGPVRRPRPDFAALTVAADGAVTLAPGVMSVGQGHETALVSIAAAGLGIAPERVAYRHGDTEALGDGRGNGGSSGLAVGGAAVAAAIDVLRREGARRAAERLDCGADEVAFRDGAFHRQGSNRSVALGEIAEGDPDGVWRVEARFTPEAATFPNGTHLCEVEIDPETGAVRVARYAAVEDVGRVLNRVLVEGQMHGGIAQGLSLGLGERLVYDDEGQLVTGSLMDYQLPRASDLPRLSLGAVEVPTALNPLGVKGVGEAGTVGGTAALASAVGDALARAGVPVFDLPATPNRIWSALAAARRSRPEA